MDIEWAKASSLLVTRPWSDPVRVAFVELLDDKVLVLNTMSGERMFYTLEGLPVQANGPHSDTKLVARFI